jgi:hypothetical protein
MGKIQCVSHGKNEHFRDLIEKSLKNANTPLEKKIHDEYFNLKTKWKETNHYEFRVKLENLIKWYKLIHKDDTGNNVNISENENKEYLESMERIKTNQMVHNISSSGEKESASFSSSVIMNTSHTNFPEIVYETKLKKLKDKNKDYFHEKVFKGPPDSFRWPSWTASVNIPLDRSKEVFLFFYNLKVEDQIDSQIKKDLNRTLAEFILNDLSEENNKSLGQDPASNSLYRVLKAYSNVDKEVSYCQGMNFIAGFLLIISDFNEVDTFYMLISLFSHTFSNDYGIRGFFSENFPLLNGFTYAFNVLFDKKMPGLKEHFNKLEMPEEIWISKWIQTLYTICFPLEASMRLYDCLISKGINFIISFSIQFIKQFENELLKLQDSSEVIEFFKIVFQGKNKKILNIENIIYNATKLEITNILIDKLVNEYFQKNKINYESQYKKLDLKIKKLTIAISDVETISNTNSNAYSNNLESKSVNVDLLYDEDIVDFPDDMNTAESDKLGVKMRGYTLNPKLLSK